ASRLNLQHTNLLRAVDGNLVLAPLQLQSDDNVLECATGTGIWLLQLLSKTQAEVSFTGIDLSPHLFPPTRTIPPNATFLTQSILSLPPDWSNKFALIHQRLLIAALRTTEWPLVADNYFRALRPGGWVQFCEVDPPGCMSVGPATARVRGMQRELMRKRGLDWECATHLPGWLANSGFVHVETVMRKVPVGARAGDGDNNYTEACVGMFLALTVTMLAAEIVVDEGQYIDAVKNMREEWDTVDNAHVPFHWIWAQKPFQC
ncbi:S-adenosyl-L-methionine-dependent methyltransferase, partial [Exidia glandulosa HHB12029]